MKTAFLDSSVLFTAVNSPTGGAAKLFTVKNIQKITSRVVLTEVERNIKKKLLDYHLKRFLLLVEKLKLVDLPVDPSLVRKAQNAIVKKDAVILSQAKQAMVDFLVTLDRKHFFTTKAVRFVKPTKIVTPKELLTV